MSNVTEHPVQSMRERTKQQMHQTMTEAPLSGKLIAECAGPTPLSTLCFYAVNSSVVICQLWHDGGWSHYIQGRSYTLAATVEEIAKATKVQA